MRKLCLGGAFNPIHHGHLICGRAVLEELGYDQLVLIPSAVPPLKQSAADMATAADRLRMCQLATSSTAHVEVDPVELERDSPSFTLETARELKRRGWKQVSWLIGSDALHDLPRWHDLPSLLKEVNFIVMARPGWKVDLGSIPPEVRSLLQNVVKSPQIDISATQIRTRVAAGLSIDYLTPPAVWQYIATTNLYRRRC